MDWSKILLVQIMGFLVEIWLTYKSSQVAKGPNSSNLKTFKQIQKAKTNKIFISLLFYIILTPYNLMTWLKEIPLFKNVFIICSLPLIGSLYPSRYHTISGGGLPSASQGNLTILAVGDSCDSGLLVILGGRNTCSTLNSCVKTTLMILNLRHKQAVI